MELSILLRLVGVMKLILISSHSFSIGGRELYLYDFFLTKKPLTFACIYKPISFRLGAMIGATKLESYILVLVWIILTFVQVKVTVV